MSKQELQSAVALILGGYLHHGGDLAEAIEAVQQELDDWAQNIEPPKATES